MVRRRRAARDIHYRDYYTDPPQQMPGPRRKGAAPYEPTPMYKPEEFGHPHERAEEQSTEPFQWQLPNWAQSGYQLYYYPGYGFFDHPPYFSYTPDGRILVASYGTARFNRPPVAEPAEFRPLLHAPEMVDIYYLDEFMGDLPLKLLMRFSSVAGVTFSRSRKRRIWGKKKNTYAERSSYPLEGAADSVLDGMDRGETSPEGVCPSSTVVSSTPTRIWSYSRGRSQTRSTEMTTPRDRSTSPTIQARTRSAGKRSRRTEMGRKELRLDLNVVEMPQKEAILYAMSWMKSNEMADQDLLPYGPPDLTKMSFEGLIDLYQTALAFALQPWPTRLRREIYDRITNMDLDLDTFRDIVRWLPLGDSIIARTVNSFDDRVFEGAYSQVEMDKFEQYLAETGNEALKSRVHELRILRQQNRQLLQSRYRGQRHAPRVEQLQQEASQSQDATEEEEKGQENAYSEQLSSRSCERDQTTSTSISSRRRRRARRQQQAQGKDIPGAVYE